MYFHLPSIDSFYSDTTIEGENAVSRYLARLYPKAGLYGTTPLENSQVCLFLHNLRLNDPK